MKKSQYNVKELKAQMHACFSCKKEVLRTGNAILEIVSGKILFIRTIPMKFNLKFYRLNPDNITIT